MSHESGLLIFSAICTCSLMGTISKGSGLSWLDLTYLIAASRVVGRTPSDRGRGAEGSEDAGAHAQRGSVSKDNHDARSHRYTTVSRIRTDWIKHSVLNFPRHFTSRFSHVGVTGVRHPHRQGRPQAEARAHVQRKPPQPPGPRRKTPYSGPQLPPHKACPCHLSQQRPGPAESPKKVTAA